GRPPELVGAVLGGTRRPLGRRADRVLVLLGGRCVPVTAGPGPGSRVSGQASYTVALALPKSSNLGRSSRAGRWPECPRSESEAEVGPIDASCGRRPEQHFERVVWSGDAKGVVEVAFEAGPGSAG